ncbi:tripartite tricarboxylate transporter TctB family protein [Carboxydochorda subterranea]|uniref:Tripartite tricarboxylate transporter TctB family protein n=1 Tax=Carboxydichorda subterranea TaxID=3109565 RepID=A0ABZ1BXJ2_9FIRM|nr:tripartite tricarboxylate transporter TctB family protein [Limnochorda sp. L945t]WRP17340.1 tripartite tricarboxylate transporter TctB family protein [Limnochorda sp. L945t]
MRRHHDPAHRVSVDTTIGLSMALVALWYLWEAWKLPRFQMTVVVDAHVFPMAVGVALLAVSLLLAARPGPYAAPEGFHWRMPQLWRAAAVALLSLGYVHVLEPLGFVAATFAFLVAVPPVLGWRRWASTVAVAATFSLAIWYFFNNLLQVPLPRGVWPL